MTEKVRCLYRISQNSFFLWFWLSTFPIESLQVQQRQFKTKFETLSSQNKHFEMFEQWPAFQRLFLHFCWSTNGQQQIRFVNTVWTAKIINAVCPNFWIRSQSSTESVCYRNDLNSFRLASSQWLPKSSDPLAWFKIENRNLKASSTIKAFWSAQLDVLLAKVANLIEIHFRWSYTMAYESHWLAAHWISLTCLRVLFAFCSWFGVLGHSASSSV